MEDFPTKMVCVIKVF